MKFLHPFLFALTMVGCTWEESILIENMAGTVVLPAEAAMRDFVTAEGEVVTVEDVRNIGPVYLGLYASVGPGVEEYPSPSVGPQIQEGALADTYPYGGTTIGDIRYACVEFLTCKVASGRFVSFDALIEWFDTYVQDPVTDQFGNEIQSGEYLREVCYDLLEVTSEAEIRITAYEDRNGDEKIDEGDLDFVLRNDGMYEAEFTIWQQEWFDNRNLVGEDAPDEQVHGFTLWGWMDAPGVLTSEFNTCDASQSAGYQEMTYNNFFFGGRPFLDVLNEPTFYIAEGDWVSSEAFQYKTIYDTPELVLDFPVTR